MYSHISQGIAYTISVNKSLILFTFCKSIRYVYYGSFLRNYEDGQVNRASITYNE